MTKRFFVPNLPTICKRFFLAYLPLSSRVPGLHAGLPTSTATKRPGRGRRPPPAGSRRGHAPVSPNFPAPRDKLFCPFVSVRTARGSRHKDASPRPGCPAPRPADQPGSPSPAPPPGTPGRCPPLARPPPEGSRVSPAPPPHPPRAGTTPRPRRGSPGFSPGAATRKAGPPQASRPSGHTRPAGQGGVGGGGGPAGGGGSGSAAPLQARTAAGPWPRTKLPGRPASPARSPAGGEPGTRRRHRRRAGPGVAR